MFKLRTRDLLASRTLRVVSHLGTPSQRLVFGQNYKRAIATVQTLPSWNVEHFRENAFTAQIPAVLPSLGTKSPAAIRKWFLQDIDQNAKIVPTQSNGPSLDPRFWSKHSDLIVPLEITYFKHAAQDQVVAFERIGGSLSLLLDNLGIEEHGKKHRRSIYLAQHDLRDLPEELQNDLSTPELVYRAGKGDLYSSSLWLGRSPTYTPLHRDPNPNLLMQLAGTKLIRLFHPDIGRSLFDYAHQLVQHQSDNYHTTSETLRGEEMMEGLERKVFHDLVWSESSETIQNESILQHAQHATIHAGQALFIPKGWWHTVKGAGDGVTASANWWFR